MPLCGSRSPGWVATGILLLAIGCGGGNGTTSPSGNATIMIQDSPFTDAQAVLVTFSSVSAHTSGGDFQTLPFADGASSRTCDLKMLQGVQNVLGTGSLAPGHYTQIRLVVVSASLYFDAPSSGPACAASITPPSGRSAQVDVPSGDLRLNHEFDVTMATATLVLDFDGNSSIHQEGNGRYTMTPVVTVAGP